MKSKFAIYLLSALFGGSMVTSCESDMNLPVENDQESMEYSVMVNSFNLVANDSIMSNLDSLFFAIDLDKAEIFNPDSLPKGIIIGKTPVEIGLPGVSEATITMPTGKGDETTTVDYLNNKTDSIDFSKGSVKLTLKSYNGKVSRTYTIKVNIHQLEPDSLTWDKVGVRPMPGALNNITDSRTLAFNDDVLCYTSNGTASELSICSNPFAGVWTTTSVSLPANGRIRSITAAGDALYMVDSSDNLYKSTDGKSWAATGKKMHHIYGGYGDVVVGVELGSDGKYRHSTYPGSTGSVVNDDCPVTETSPSVTYSTKWSDKPMMMIAGGKTASGKPVGSVWAYDGNTWAGVTQNGYNFPEVSAPVIFPYFSFTTDYITWESTKFDMLFLIGGKKADGSVNDKIYLSPDRGVHWSQSEGLMAKPSFLPNLYGLDGLVRENTMHAGSRSVSGWKEYPVNIPFWYTPVVSMDGSRAVTPITEWQCPFIYLFGGHLANGTYNNQVWRGVINQLMFRPVQ